MPLHVIPVLRIFDYAKTIEFYKNWLEFNIDWEHRFEPDLPIYMQVSLEHIVLHLSEHHGDCCPGAKVFIQYSDLRSLHRKLIDKKYHYNRPGLEKAPWNAITMELTDPFGNKLLFSEALNSSKE